MKILHTSDWHLGKNLYDFSLLDDQQQMIDQLLLLLEEQQVDAVLLAGDIYDRPVPSAQAVQLYDHFLARAVGDMGIPVLAVAGNHDSASRLEFGSSLYRTSGYHVCGHVRREARRVTLQDQHGPVDFWLLPYLHPADVRPFFPGQAVRTFDDAYRLLLGEYTAALDPARRNVALAHGFFSDLGDRQAAEKEQITSDSEVNIGGIDIADSAAFAPFDYTALGHLHAPQRVGGEKIRYSGSPLKYSLSEERQNKSFTLLELGAKGELQVSALPRLPGPAMRDVRTVTGSLEQLLEPAFHTNRQFDDYVFANLTDAGALYPMEKLRKLFPHLLGLRLLGQEDGVMPQMAVGGRLPRLSPEELFCRFFREVKGFDIPPESLAFLQETLCTSEQEDTE